jgi:hypothetical protein
MQQPALRRRTASSPSIHCEFTLEQNPRSDQRSPILPSAINSDENDNFIKLQGENGKTGLRRPFPPFNPLSPKWGRSRCAKILFIFFLTSGSRTAFLLNCLAWLFTERIFQSDRSFHANDFVRRYAMVEEPVRRRFATVLTQSKRTTFGIKIIQA